jgi:hypothetical protein
MWTAADGVPHFLALDTLPRTATNLRVSLELYPPPADAPASLSVRLAIVPEGAADPIMEHDLTPSNHGDRISVTGDVPVSSLPVGAYSIRATILEAGTTVGSISKVLHKNE